MKPLPHDALKFIDMFENYDDITTMMHFHVVSLFPEAIEPYLKRSILGRAIEEKKIKVSYYDPKDFSLPARGKKARAQDMRVDRRPYGGGPGMVLRPDPILKAVEKARGKKKKVMIIFFATDGEQFTEEMAKRMANPKGDAFRNIIFICGRYEGIDARVQKILKAKKVTVGPYVVTGGELPAAIMIDVIARFIPGVLGKAESLEASRVSSPEVYTRPEVLEWKKKKYRVPKVLLGGNHAEMDAWKASIRSKKSK